jgi:hypothetical protein
MINTYNYEEIKNYTPKKRMFLWKYEDFEGNSNKKVVIYKMQDQSSSNVDDNGIDAEKKVYNSKTISITGVGTLIWEMCDGSNSVDSIISAISEQYSCDFEKVMLDSLQFLEQLEQQELIDLNWEWF